MSDELTLLIIIIIMHLLNIQTDTRSVGVIAPHV